MVPSDGDLLRAARRNPEPFRQFYDRHADSIYWWLRRRIDEPAASELTAETFAIAWQARHRFRDDGQHSGLRWLFGIARNLQRRWARDSRVEDSARRRLGMSEIRQGPENDFLDADSRLDGDVIAGRLRAALATLPDSQRAAVELRVLDELTFAEVASRLGCTEGAARVRVTRGLCKLRVGMAKDAELCL